MTDKRDSQATQTSVPAPRTDVLFPQIARLELDELLSELIGRAQDVLETQGRLRALLAATRAVSEELSLPSVLQRIVEAACQLVGAQYGAIGVLGPGDVLEQFIHVGIPPEDRTRIGPLPTGRGILGLLISDPMPLRLEDLHSHPASVGFPAEHPPMQSFLGVPIRVRDRVFGNIYVTEKSGGRPFTPDDEELLVALAGTAAMAIDHAQLFSSAQARHQALATASEAARLIADDGKNQLTLIARYARELANGDLAVIIGADPSGRLRVTAADGAGAGEIRGVVIRDAGQEAVIDELRHRGVHYTSVLEAPVIDQAGAPAQLLLMRAVTSFTFTEAEAFRLFSEQMSAAVAEKVSQRNARLVDLLRQRDAIGREMNDQVVSRVFASGLTLQGVANRIADPALKAQITAEIEQLDQVIRTIRTSIFASEAPPQPESESESE